MTNCTQKTLWWRHNGISSVQVMKFTSDRHTLYNTLPSNQSLPCPLSHNPLFAIQSSFLCFSLNFDPVWFWSLMTKVKGFAKKEIDQYCNQRLRMYKVGTNKLMKILLIGVFLNWFCKLVLRLAFECVLCDPWDRLPYAIPPWYISPSSRCAEP